jgi:hypothetical protein
MAYDPNDPMKDRITDIGPPHYEQFFPPVIKVITASGSITRFSSQVFSFTYRKLAPRSIP